MRAWVGCLSCYNNGGLTGAWVDGIDADEYIPCQIAGHEEWWVFDLEDYHGLIEGECSPAEAADLARRLDDLSEEEIQPYAAWVVQCGGDRNIERFREAYNGEFCSREEFAEYVADGIGAIDPDAGWPMRHIDWRAAADDLFQDYMEASAPGGIYVYR